MQGVIIQDFLPYYTGASKGWRNLQNKRLLPLQSCVRFLLLAYDIHVKRVYLYDALPKVVGFFGYPVFSRKECWQCGLGLAPNWPLRRSCASWSNMSHNVTLRGALRKPSTRSGWLASFAIQLSSQLQVRMISILPLTVLQFLLPRTEDGTNVRFKAYLIFKNYDTCCVGVMYSGE
jgi:hypothetical protein